MSDQDILLIVKVVKQVLEEHKASGKPFGEFAAASAEGASMAVQQVAEHAQVTENGAFSGLGASGVQGANDDWRGIPSEVDILKEQIESLQEMVALIQRNAEEVTAEEVDKALKDAKKIEEQLQEQIMSQEEMIKMIITHADETSAERIDKARKEAKEIEEQLQEQIMSQEEMIKMIVTHADETSAERVDKARKEAKEIEEQLQEQIMSQEEMIKMIVTHADETSAERVDKARKEAKEIEEQLQEQISVQQEMFALTCQYMSEQLDEARARIAELESGHASQLSAAAENSAPIESAMPTDHESSTEQATESVVATQASPNTEVSQQPTFGTVPDTDVAVEAVVAPVAVPVEATPAPTETEGQPITETETSVVEQEHTAVAAAKKLLQQHLGAAERVAPYFEEAWLVNSVPEQGLNSYFYAKDMRGKLFIITVNGKLQGVSSVVFNSISSIMLYHLVVERRIDNTAEILEDMLSNMPALLESIGENTATEPLIGVCMLDRQTNQLCYSSKGLELILVNGGRRRTIQGGEVAQKRPASFRHEISEVTLKRDNVLYFTSVPLAEQLHHRQDPKDFMTYADMLTELSGVQMGEQPNKLKQFFRDYQTDEEAANSFVLGVKIR